MILKLDQFRGLAPRLAPVDLPQQAGQVATNCLFGSGSLRPLVSEGTVTVTDSLVSGTKRSIFKYTGNRWLAWLADINVCRSSVALDSFDRLYWTGDGAPKMGGNTKILSGSSKPGGYWNLGIPKPSAVPSTSASSPSGTVDDVTYAYVYTYVSAYGEEGPPSDPSPNRTITPPATVTVSGMSTSPGADYNIVSKNIYRVNTGSTTSEFQYVASVAVATTSYADSKASADLGEVLPSATWIAPNSTMVGIISHPGGFLVGFYKNVICPSEPYMPHAYPAQYQITVDAEIVAIGAYGNSILVVTKGMPYIITGSTPGQLSLPEKLEKGEACILKRGFVDMGYVCVFPGPSGLWVAGTGSVELATASLMTKKEWVAYSASLVFAVQYGNLYIGFMATGGFIFDTATGDFSTHDITATAGWYDRTEGKLYLVVGGTIVEWSTGSSVHNLTWKSKKFQVPFPVNFGAAQVFAAGPVTIKVYADGTLKQTETQGSASASPFRLPSGFRATNWEVQIEGSYEVTSVFIASTMSELAQV
jgi:hypothetical protein